VDLAQDGNGGEILFASDDFFACCELMISQKEPTFDIDAYTEQGKLMDGWETRRKRTLGHDFCIIKLGFSGEIKEIDADTAFFTGNNVPALSIQGFCTDQRLEWGRKPIQGSAADPNLLEDVDKMTKNWTEIVPITPLKPGYPETRHNLIKVADTGRYTHLRVNLYPDGGLSRLRVMGTVHPDWKRVTAKIDLISLGWGGNVLEFSNAHYGHPQRLLAPKRSTGMHDGWETARNPNRPAIFKMGSDDMIEMVGKDWAVIQLGRSGNVSEILVDTNHYKGNYPESCEIEYSSDDSNNWKPLLKRVKLNAHEERTFSVDAKDICKVRLTMYPDGGISRLRIFGTPK